MNSLKEAAQKIIGNSQPINMSSLAQQLNLSPPISLKTICNEADHYGKYIFLLDNFQITNTRSRHEDTDYVSFKIKVGNEDIYPNQTKYMGDLNNGTFNVGLEFGPISISDPNTLVVFNYQIINSGHQNAAEIQNVLNQGSDALLTKENVGILLTGEAVGGIWGLVIAGGIVGLKELYKIIFADCDGFVAVDEVAVKGSTLKDWVSSSGSYSETRSYPGYDSPVGCGSNSQYYVTWSVKKA